MAKRLTDTDIWDKEWFMQLPPKLKCAVKFLRDKCDLSGVWSPNWQLAEFYIGDKITKEEVLNIDGGNQFLELENGRIFCFQFIEFQNGILPDLNTEKKISPIHLKIISMLKTNNLEKKDVGYIYPINRVLDRGIVIVKERVIVGVEVKKKKEQEKITEIFNSEKWIEETAMKYRKNYDVLVSNLDDFLQEQKLKDEIYHREVKEIKSHFINWLKIQIEKENIKNGSKKKSEFGNDKNAASREAVDRFADDLLQQHISKRSGDTQE